MKKICLLGASGSIGIQTLDVLTQYHDRFELVAFSVGSQTEKAFDIIEQFNVNYIYANDITELQATNPDKHFYTGDQGLVDLISDCDCDWVVNALSGFVGFVPTLEAIKMGKSIALANKETLVAGGSLIMKLVQEYRVNLTPIDSEHSAIYQALIGHSIDEVKRIYLTASGGAFRDLTRAECSNKTKSEALKHPNWEMGAKITIDSATMMNKGLEVIEAHWLFGLDYERIGVLIQPESHIHSLVEFKDTSIMAQMASSDMRLPILMALSDERHLPLDIEPLNLFDTTFTLKGVQPGRYPLFECAIEMGRLGGIAPAVMNGANEVAVEYYLKDRISYNDLENTVLRVCDRIEFREIKTVQDVLDADKLGRDLAYQCLEEVIVNGYVN